MGCAEISQFKELIIALIIIGLVGHQTSELYVGIEVVIRWIGVFLSRCRPHRLDPILCGIIGTTQRITIGGDIPCYGMGRIAIGVVQGQ